METTTTIAVLLAAVGLLGLGAAAIFGALLAGDGPIASGVISATAFLLVLELFLWSDAFTFGPKDR